MVDVQQISCYGATRQWLKEYLDTHPGVYNSTVSQRSISIALFMHWIEPQTYCWVIASLRTLLCLHHAWLVSPFDPLCKCLIPSLDILVSQIGKKNKTKQFWPFCICCLSCIKSYYSFMLLSINYTAKITMAGEVVPYYTVIALVPTLK